MEKKPTYVGMNKWFGFASITVHSLLLDQRWRIKKADSEPKPKMLLAEFGLATLE